MNNQNKLFVGSLPWATDDDALNNLFAAIGPVVSAKIIIDRETGRSKGYGFVEMENPEDAKKAVTDLHESEVEGRKIVVKIADPKPDYGAKRGGSNNNRR